jgi:hypothetical protein
MKYRIVVMAVFDVLDEIGRSFGRFGGIEFKGDIAVIGLQLDLEQAFALSSMDYLPLGAGLASSTVTFSMVMVLTGRF